MWTIGNGDQRSGGHSVSNCGPKGAQHQLAVVLHTVIVVSVVLEDRQA